MIVAEFCDLIKKTRVKNEKGSLPFNLGSYYNEFQIINYLGEDIFALDHQNQVVKIKPQENGASIPKEEDRCIVIQYRFVEGPRQIGSGAIEITPATHCTMTIPRSVLLEETIFVEEINALLYCARWHPYTKLHPHSKEYIEQQQDRLRNEIGRAAVYNPITIMANDPTGKIKSLHIELNGQICSVMVTNYTGEYEADVFTMCIRGTKNGLITDCKIIRTTFSELLRQNPLCWELGGFLISSDRIWLENKMEVDRIKPTANVVPVEEVKTLLSRARIEDLSTIESLSETITQKDRELKEWKSRYRSLNESYEDLTKNGYIDRNSETVFKKLELEESELLASVEKAKLAKSTERMKLTKEQISTIATIAKTIAVIIPLIGLYLKYKEKQAA